MPQVGEAQSADERRVESVLGAASGVEPSLSSAIVAYERVVGPVASPMHCGIDGDGWRIDVPGHHKLFLKLYSGDTTKFFDLAASFEAAGLAGSAGLAPKLVWSDVKLRAAIWEFVGQTWRVATFDDSWSRVIFQRVAGNLRQLHRGPLFGNKKTVFERLEEHVDLARTKNVRLPLDFEWMFANVRDAGLAIKAAGADYAPCHTDLIASNILVSRDGPVMFVDWDEACDSDPHWDLGMYMAEAFPFDDGALQMLECYCGRPDRTILARCRLYGIAGDLSWAVRSLILANQTSRADIEYFKYAQWRALRCRVALHDPKFEQMLRAV